ncbi:MAG TPA: AAA family ATPase, partial [Longimicrobiales bacterium]|nr:AAA family ATPase [Longimicrobiales bacterium]
MPRIQLMGEVALLVEGQAVQLRSTKELGLLASLAEAHPRPITRNYLLELLWPQSETDRARRSLNQAVYAIRQVVGQDALRPQLDLLSLAGSDWTCDLWELDDLVAEAARTKTPLDRFARGGRLPSTELFRDWAERAGARVDAYLVSAYCAELGKLMDRGRFEAVEPIARAVLQIDPYAETGLYHLALAIARSGRITAGLQELAKARERFRDDLDRDLPAAFDTLEERLRSAEAFEASRRPKGGRDATVFPFVGREEEFAHLRSAWEGIAETGRRIVLISGEPGIGKTRLVDRLARLASIEGGRVLHAECFAAHKRVAFAAISEALRGLRPEELSELDSIWRRVLFSSLALEAVGTDLKPPPRLDPEAEQLRLFESVTLAVQAAAARRPVLVVVDDLQWLDQSSAAVLQHMIRRCEDEPVLFVLAARERELRVDDELR